MTSVFESHPTFRMPRVPAGKFVIVTLSYDGDDPLKFRGLFETSGCEKMGEQNETYILRRVQGPNVPAEFIKVPRRWQESGHLIVYELRRDEQYSA